MLDHGVLREMTMEELHHVSALLLWIHGDDGWLLFLLKRKRPSLVMA